MEVKVDGMQSTVENNTIQNDSSVENGAISQNRILVDFKVSNDLYIRHGNISYAELLKLIKNL